MSPSLKEGQHKERESHDYADYYHDEVHDEQLDEQYWCDTDEGFHTFKHTDLFCIFGRIASLHERLQGEKWHLSDKEWPQHGDYIGTEPHGMFRYGKEVDHIHVTDKVCTRQVLKHE